LQLFLHKRRKESFNLTSYRLTNQQMSTSKRFNFTNFYQNSVMFMDFSEVGVYASCMVFSFLCFMWKCDFVGQSFIFSVIFWFEFCFLPIYWRSQNIVYQDCFRLKINIYIKYSLPIILHDLIEIKIQNYKRKNKV